MARTKQVYVVAEIVPLNATGECFSFWAVAYNERICSAALILEEMESINEDRELLLGRDPSNVDEKRKVRRTKKAHSCLSEISSRDGLANGKVSVGIQGVVYYMQTSVREAAILE